jgi:hypothetical protein
MKAERARNEGVGRPREASGRTMAFATSDRSDTLAELRSAIERILVVQTSEDWRCDDALT